MEEQVVNKNTRTAASVPNVKEFFFRYIKFLPLYIVFVALSLIGAYIYIRYATEVYRSEGQLAIKDEKNSVSGGDDRIDVLMQSDGRKNIQMEVEVLQSVPLMSRVVEGLNLNFNYTAKGRFKGTNVYKVAPFKIEALKIADSTGSFVVNLNFPTQTEFTVNGSTRQFSFGEIFSTADGQFRLVKTEAGDVHQDYIITWNPTTQQAKMILSSLAIAPKQNTGILNIVIESTSPILAADVINELMEVYKEVTIEDKNASTKKSLDFIDANLREREQELDSIKQIYVAYQRVNNIIDPETQSTNYFARVEDALRLEQDQRLRLNNATRIQDYLRDKGNDLTTVPSSLGIEDPTLNGLVSSYNKTQMERKELLENVMPGHVMVKHKTEEAEALREKILENVRNIRSSYSSTIGMLRSTGSQATSQLKTLPNKKQDLINIQQQLESKAQIYNTLLVKREESAIALASTISNTKVLQEAEPNPQPVKPRSRNIQMLAIVVGIIIPTLIIVILEVLNDKVTSKNDIERLTDATVLGEVGHSQGQQTLVVTTSNRKVIAEQFRILRSNLQYVINSVEKPVIMVTSSFSGEGKSFISTNMGAVMALANKKTVILEFDIRKPKVMSGLGLPKNAGLTNFILGTVTADKLPLPVPSCENLFVLPCGPIPPNPSELLLDPKLTELFSYLRQNFDVVIIDTAPVGMVSDALTLSKYADCTLYIVRQRHTFKKQISLVNEYYLQGKLPKLSIVMNDVKIGSGYGNYGYGYGYGYGSGYFEDEDPKVNNFNKWFGWLGAKNGTEKKRKSKKV
jgi:capsular exopolysaccharide synthesis family protein